MNICKITSILIFLSTISWAQTSININVSQFGANGNDKKDDTQSFHTSIDYLANKGGGTLSIPKGNYYISHLKFFGKKYSNITIKGDKAVINQITPKNRKTVHNGLYKTFSERYAADGCFVFDAQVSNQKDDTNSIKNINISGLNFQSDVKNKGFDELLHQLSAHGVSNFVVENCSFTGFFGDGIAINAGTDLAIYSYAYNKNVEIRNCSFDGVNKDNRQGISIYYCDGFLIENSSFKNITRKNMPGAIDIEPDRDFLVSRNGTIRNCSFDNIGGIAAVNIVMFPSTVSNQFSNKNYVIENCTFNNVNSAVGVIGNNSFKTFNSEEDYVTFRNSKVTNSFSALDIRKGYGVLIDNVDFTNIYTTTNNLVTDGGATDITFKNCTFDTIKNRNGFGFHGQTKSINFIGNTFQNFAIHAITINDINGVGEISNNKFLSTNYKGGFPLVTQYYIKKSVIKNMKILNNTSQQNFNNLDINYFYKPK